MSDQLPFSLAIKKSNTDEWYTKPEDVELILPYLKRRPFKKILCPFDKEESNFVRILQMRGGYEVSYSHIETGTDFFDISDFSKYDAVVSNPPFSKREQIMRRLYENNIPFALVMNLNGLFDSKGRWEMFRKYGCELLIPLGRMHFYNEECRGNAPNFQSVYVCHGILDKQIVFAEREYGQMNILDFMEEGQ